MLLLMHSTQVFGVDLMTGLQYLHSHGVLFCDLKPSNVLVDEYGVVKLSDFGLSRRVPQAPTSPGSGSGSGGGPRKRGTPYYMAPELFLDEAFASIDQQTFLQEGGSLEVSVYDDGSSDSSSR